MSMNEKSTKIIKKVISNRSDRTSNLPISHCTYVGAFDSLTNSEIFNDI
jgi:hypothetical protein